ncbi:hypothetical protein [Streptomyces lanatus]|uniref:DUF3239 domain-containing protein n=1 Tax=Streptomyces lanatus TaxID=66900 RepID=A0ABV1XW63_9ACTN|nr:hypothetical protein [Streptomyces lanatus]GHH16656.1 hypothetical protein GCM10018780_59330 [Streptomyces lanatus]
MTSPTATPDIEQVLKHNRSKWKRHVRERIAVSLGLIAVPVVLHAVGVPDAFFTPLPILAAFFVLLFLLLRASRGRRLAACERVLRTYPLEYRTRVAKKGQQWLLQGTVFTVKVSTRGQHGAPLMRALDASTVRRWPKGAEDGGAWVAGDLPFGGVMIVPGTNDMLFMQPADWAKFADEREQADASRSALAQQAGLIELVEKEPNITYFY